MNQWIDPDQFDLQMDQFNCHFDQLIYCKHTQNKIMTQNNDSISIEHSMASKTWNIAHDSYGLLLVFCHSFWSLKALVAICCNCMEKTNLLCFTKKRKLYQFGTTWRWVYYC